MISVTIVYLAVFALCTTMLLGERGFSTDLRSRRGRSQTIRGGRRAIDPGSATQA